MSTTPPKPTLTPTRIAMLGSGKVGGALAHRLVVLGHDVVLAARDSRSASVRATLARDERLRAVAVRDAVASSEVVFLATPWAATEDALHAAGPLEGKVLVDCTNPIGPGLSLAVCGQDSGGERVQALVPDARVVKAFSVYGYENFDDSAYPGHGELLPVMPIAGDDASALELVASFAAELGFEPLVAGGIVMCRSLEPLALLWIHLARVQQRGSGFTWGVLRRG